MRNQVCIKIMNDASKVDIASPGAETVKTMQEDAEDDHIVLRSNRTLRDMAQLAAKAQCYVIADNRYEVPCTVCGVLTVDDARRASDIQPVCERCAVRLDSSCGDAMSRSGSGSMAS